MDEGAGARSKGIAAGLIAFSYGHIYAVALNAGAAGWEAAIIAATVDGRGHRVSERTGRRTLKDVRAALEEMATA